MKTLPDLKTPFREMSVIEIMRCMFGLKGFETEIYLELVHRGSLTVNDLVAKFGKDRSTIQRALQNLTIAGLIYREQKNIKNGGYYYVYHAAPFDEIKDTMKASILKWCDAVIKWIDDLNP
ncbi:helix-turn-helix domain-containing protein [Candidatus Pyrohabitans sp.]